MKVIPKTRVVRTKFDIYVFIFNYISVKMDKHFCNNMKNKLNQ